MLQRIAVVALLGATALRPAPARAADLPPLRPGEPPYFTADVAVALDSDGRPALSVSLSVPYGELQWLKLQRGYGAGMEFSVSFQPRRAGRIYGDVWERRVVLPDFELTRSSTRAVVDKRTFQVPPGRYNVRLTLRDFNADMQSLARGTIEVPDYSRVPLGFADLELGTVDSLGAFSPVATRSFGLEVSRLAARAELFDRRPGAWPRHYDFHYRLLDDQGEPILQGDKGATLARSADPLVVKPDSSALFVGAYTFELELTEGKSRWRVDRSFTVEESGPPRGKEFTRMLDALAYIADQREIDHLKNLPPEDQARGWDEFWKRRDPTPDTPRNEAMLEFLRRVRYAGAHFQGYGPGWRSDMGRIYIKFGAPDQVDSRPANSIEPPTEIWYYNQPYRRFVFRDQDGFGRFVLEEPAPE